MNEKTEKRLEEALTFFRAQGPGHRNCAQTVLMFAERAGADTELVALARYLGGGLARSGLTCGALCAAMLVQGRRDRGVGYDQAERIDQGHRLLRGIVQEVSERFQATDCRTLLKGCDLAAPDGLAHYRASSLMQDRCLPILRLVCERLAEGCIP